MLEGIGEADLLGHISDLIDEDLIKTIVEKAELIIYLRKLYVGIGMAAPALGAPLPAAPALPPPPQQQIVISNPADTAVTNSATVALSEYVDQSSRVMAKLLTFEELTACRLRFERAAGRPALRWGASTRHSWGHGGVRWEQQGRG